MHWFPIREAFIGFIMIAAAQYIQNVDLKRTYPSKRPVVDTVSLNGAAPLLENFQPAEPAWIWGFQACEDNLIVTTDVPTNERDPSM
jgi:hypothetical protein